MRFFRAVILLITTWLLAANVVYGQVVRDSVQIYFRQGHSALDLSIRDNAKTLNHIADILKERESDSKYRLSEITVIGGASPEGSVSINKKLSAKRANVLFDHLSKHRHLPDSLRTHAYLGRDWRGLLNLVELDENVPHRQQTIELLQTIIAELEAGKDDTNDNISRLQSLKGGVPYRYMYRMMFPELRSSRLVLHYSLVSEPIRPLAAPLGLAPSPIRMGESKFKIIPYEVEQQIKKPFYMALKTSLLYDALMVPNIGAEFYLGGSISVHANWMYSWWNNDATNWYWRIYGGDFGLRTWFGRAAKEKPLTGHHLGAYIQAFTYDFEAGGRGYMGGDPGGNIFDRANYAVGLEYGYSLPVARRLNIDFTIGAGYMWGTYHEYLPIDDCYVWQMTKNRNYFGPLKAEISLVWQIGRGNVNAKKGGRR